MNAFVRKLAVPALLALAAPGVEAAQNPDCSKQPETCIALAVVETAAYADECAKLYPESRDEFARSLARWSVRKLQIPGVEEALEPGSADRVALAKRAAAYLKSVGSYQREIECNGRLAVMKNKEPRLRSDYFVLPPDPLEPYIR